MVVVLQDGTVKQEMLTLAEPHHDRIDALRGNLDRDMREFRRRHVAEGKLAAFSHATAELADYIDVRRLQLVRELSPSSGSDEG